MIHTIRTVAVGDRESKIDSPIILYRGDREVEVEFTINGSKFTFTNGGNVIKSTNATHGQLVINTPTGENMFSEVTECHDGKVVFVITKEMIDELIEVGFYSFQIRLFDESQVSRVTIPPVLKGIDIRNPIAAEDETNVVDIGLVDYAVVVKDEFEDLSTFLPDRNYNKTNWESKDVISSAKLNKIEDALYNINSNMEATDLALLNKIENSAKNILDALKVVNADGRLDALEGINADGRLDALENVDADSRLDKLDEQIERLKTQEFINIKDFGVVGDGRDETKNIQLAFDSIAPGKILYFPSGDYRTRGIYFKNGDGYDIVEIMGESGKYLSKEGLEDNPRGGTVLTYIGENGGCLFDKLETCTNGRRVYISDMYFKGCNNTSEQGYQKNHFLYTGRNGSSNGAYPNLYANNCTFWGFETVCGEYAPYDYGGDSDEREDIEQTNVYLTECQFTRNKHALSNIIDSYIDKCVFNLNDVAVILRKWGFANRITNNRFEWNIEHAIYIHAGESLIENNEFDRSGYCGLYISHSISSCVIGNKFLRNGAYENSECTGSSANLIDNLENIHVYFANNRDCIFKGNLTREERQWDDGTGDVVPNKCGVFIKNLNCVMTDNVLTGGFIKYQDSSMLNVFSDNAYCNIDNVVYQSRQVVNYGYQNTFTLDPNNYKYIPILNIEKVSTSYPSQVFTLTVTCFKSSIIDHEHTLCHEVSFILFNSGNNQGYILGKTISRMGDDTPPFQLANIDYFRESNTLGLNILNNTDTSNLYCISFR